MTRIVVLDSGPLGLVTSPSGADDAFRSQIWLRELSLTTRVALPEIADYEVRRELIRARKLAGLRRLDQLKARVRYLPITTDVMLLAASLWAEARQQGRPTADNTALDGNVILAAQARSLLDAGHDVIVATNNVEHLARFVPAATWQEIRQP